MTDLFAGLMRRTPQILVWTGVAIYLSQIVVGIAAGTELASMIQETLPLALKARAFVTLFVQPLTSPMLLLFGAALLGRLDRRGMAVEAGVPA